ncbi:hypothetical protein BgiMline_022404 [Biomphalaria glabrata]|uniref:Uncharacterized protein LOC106051117 n=1 Tax=Biomphalaria glabrata TaxID=6526 RepID=A0A9U8DVL2_BIOGL|nr:uncharacterized protein LOC106051117 [Biomphalaria glabrata]KAI8756747.1 hypothetical protein BgiMline_010262 [Biomphalaria glabrata]KAI8798155.1 hypothetical protein BgiBS90_000458 [Biomphalaria glabrata]
MAKRKDPPLPFFQRCCILKLLTFERVALLFSFFFVNLAAFAISAELACLILVPNTIFLMHAGLVCRLITLGIFFITPAILSMYSLEAFYVLSIHSIFYVAVFMKHFVENSAACPCEQDKKD